jgi:2'-5' RNA ligase
LPHPESALIVAVPEAEPLVGDWRERYDSSAAAGVPAHVTLLYPFVSPDRIDAGVLAALETIFSTSEPFGFTLDAVARFPDVLYLAPRPSEPFVRLTEALFAAFPAYPPYGGIHDEVVPHLTVAQTLDQAVLGAVSAAVAPGLPLEAFASEALLLAQDEAGHWRTRSRFPLRGRREYS